MRVREILSISRAIEASDTYFFLNLAIDASEIRQPVGVCQPSSNLAETRPSTQPQSQHISLVTSEHVLALPFWRARSFFPNCRNSARETNRPRTVPSTFPHTRSSPDRSARMILAVPSPVP